MQHNQLGPVLAAQFFAVPDSESPLALVRARGGGLEVLKGEHSIHTLGGITAHSYEAISFDESPELKQVYTTEAGWNLKELAALLTPAAVDDSSRLLAVVSERRAVRPCEVGHD